MAIASTKRPPFSDEAPRAAGPQEMASRTEEQNLGELIQRYAQAKWGEPQDRQAATELSACLDRNLVDRLDILGADGVRLLRVTPAKVLAELMALEREAAREDTRAAAAAAKARTKEEATYQDGRAQNATHHDPMRNGRHRQATGRRNHRQRRQS